MKKRAFFVSLLAIVMAAENAKAAPTADKESRALTIERLMKVNDYWHPLLDVASGKKFTDAEKMAALESAVNNTWQQSNCFTPGILSPNVIVMTKLNVAYKKKYPNFQGSISTETALDMLHHTKISIEHGFWASGRYRSLRYAADGATGDANYDPGHPGPNDPHENVETDEILTWEGIPLFRWECLNPIKEVTVQYNPIPDNGNTYVPKRTQGELTGGNYMNNSNTVYVVVPQQQQSEPQIQYVPERKQSAWGYFAAAVGGAIVGAALNGGQRGYYDNYGGYPINTGFQQDWRYGRGRVITQPPPVYQQPPPRRYVNNEQLLPGVPINQGGSRFVSYGSLR